MASPLFSFPMFSSAPKGAPLLTSLSPSPPKASHLFSSGPKASLLSSPLPMASPLFSSLPMASPLLSSPPSPMKSVMCLKSHGEGENAAATFFDTFVEHLLSNLYIPTHSVKYKHWIELAFRSLFDLEVPFEDDVGEVRMKNKSCVFNITSPSSQLFFLEKEIVYMKGEELVEEIPYFNLEEKDRNKIVLLPQEQRWRSLAHQGIILPPLYQSHNVPLLYEGKPVPLTLEQEELATMFASLMKTDFVEKDLFKHNFWRDWANFLGKGSVVTSLALCDFTLIYEWIQQEKEKKKKMSNRERMALKQLEDKYQWAVVDGFKVKTINFKVEPPRLFTGRGEHPKMGSLERRIRPCDIIINIGKGVRIPKCPIPGERWKERSTA